MSEVLFDTAINIASVVDGAAPAKILNRKCEQRKKVNQVNKAPARTYTTHCHRSSTRMNGKIHYSCMQRRLANSNNKEEPGDKNVPLTYKHTRACRESISTATPRAQPLPK